MNDVTLKGDIIIGDPCEMVKSGKDWQLCALGERMEKLGIKSFLFVEFSEDRPRKKVIEGKGSVNFRTVTEE